MTKREETDRWNVMWLDTVVTPMLLSSMKPYQRVNHFPGMYAIARKSNLCMNLNKLRKIIPAHYRFYPRTWFLSSEFCDFEKVFVRNSGSFIAKPAASSQGRGIFLVQDLEEVDKLNDYIVQEYIESPLLIEGLKFDMRIYVLVTGCDPLRIYVHKEGLARFATEKYKKPADSNLDQVFMHLTNYSLNKFNPKFVKNTKASEDSVGHKRSLSTILKFLEDKGYNVANMWKKIHDMIIKTLCSIQPSLAHNYRSCRPNDVSNAMCFEILGFDILLDDRFCPWLLEVNHSPSFETSTPLDKHVKATVIGDALLMLGLSEKDKENYESLNRAKITERSVFRKSFYEKMVNHQAEKEIAQSQKTQFEESHCGGFTKIFPNNEDYYNSIIKHSETIQEKFTGPKKTRPRTCGRTSATPPPLASRGMSSEKQQRSHLSRPQRPSLNPYKPRLNTSKN